MSSIDTIDGLVERRRVLAARDVVRQVLAEYQAAYFALHHLPGTVEDLRILSLNAELAAGRAGTQGAAVRVATQSTRELVNQLTQITQRMNAARYRCYRCGALAIRGLPRLARFGRTIDTIRKARTQFGESGVTALRRGMIERTRDVAAEIGGLVAGGAELERLAANLDDLAIQAVAIANNLSIEAVAIKGHEAAFSAVAAEMHRHIGALKGMIGQAAVHVFSGNQAAAKIADYARQLQRQLG